MNTTTALTFKVMDKNGDIIESYNDFFKAVQRAAVINSTSWKEGATCIVADYDWLALLAEKFLEAGVTPELLEDHPDGFGTTDNDDFIICTFAYDIAQIMKEIV